MGGWCGSAVLFDFCACHFERGFELYTKTFGEVRKVEERENKTGMIEARKDAEEKEKRWLISNEIECQRATSVNCRVKLNAEQCHEMKGQKPTL